MGLGCWFTDGSFCPDRQRPVSNFSHLLAWYSLAQPFGSPTQGAITMPFPGDGVTQAITSAWSLVPIVYRASKTRAVYLNHPKINVVHLKSFYDYIISSCSHHLDIMI